MLMNALFIIAANKRTLPFKCDRSHGVQETNQKIALT